MAWPRPANRSACAHIFCSAPLSHVPLSRSLPFSPALSCALSHTHTRAHMHTCTRTHRACVAVMNTSQSRRTQSGSVNWALPRRRQNSRVCRARKQRGSLTSATSSGKSAWQWRFRVPRVPRARAPAPRPSPHMPPPPPPPPHSVSSSSGGSAHVLREQNQAPRPTQPPTHAAALRACAWQASWRQRQRQQQQQDVSGHGHHGALGPAAAAVATRWPAPLSLSPLTSRALVRLRARGQRRRRHRPCFCCCPAFHQDFIVCARTVWMCLSVPSGALPFICS